MSRICRRCRAPFQPKDWQTRNYDWRCQSCIGIEVAAQKQKGRRRRKKVDPLAAFFERNAERIMPIPECGCWVWTGALSELGYGRVRDENRKTVFAHRASWIEAKGPIPDGLNVCHRCDIPSCVNPDHLFVGTQLDNIVDMDRKGRRSQKAVVRTPGTGRSKLTIQQIHEIRSSSLPLSALADRFGVSKSAVSRVSRGVAWSGI